MEVVAPVTLTVPEVHDPAASALPPMLEGVAASGTIVAATVCPLASGRIFVCGMLWGWPPDKRGSMIRPVQKAAGGCEIAGDIVARRTTVEIPNYGGIIYLDDRGLRESRDCNKHLRCSELDAFIEVQRKQSIIPDFQNETDAAVGARTQSEATLPGSRTSGATVCIINDVKGDISRSH